MKKLKDVFYDMNDILVAIIIVVVAAFVIVGKIDVILDYPTTLAAEIQTPGEKQQTIYAEQPQDDGQNTSQENDTQGDDGQENDAQKNDENSSQDTPAGAQQNETPDNYSVYINPGSTGAQIADVLISVGLFENRQQFYDAVSAAGAEGKLRAGNFIIPSDATPAQVVSIITQ